MSQRTRMCVICKRMVEPDRAAAIEQTNLCAEHGEAIRQYGGEFRVVATQENLSKAGSLKRNPGGVATKMVRNLEALERLRKAYEQQR